MNKQKIIKFIINAIKDVQQTLDAGHYQAGQYTDIARGMVRGVSLSIQRVTEQFDGQSDKELTGLCAWGTILLMRDFEPEHIDASLARALAHFEEKARYPFEEGDDYWTIEDGRGAPEIVWSCWDDISEEIYDPCKSYFATEHDAEVALIALTKK